MASSMAPEPVMKAWPTTASWAPSSGSTYSSHIPGSVGQAKVSTILPSTWSPPSASKLWNRALASCASHHGQTRWLWSLSSGT